MPVVKEISDVVLEWIKELQIYSDYLVPQRRALAEYEKLMATNKRFSTFVRTQGARNECRGLDLQGYLVKPFQRLLKYPLLFKNLLEVSSSGTLDYINAIRCHHALEGLIMRIQEAKFRQEQAPTLEAWQEKIPSAAKFRLSDPRRRLCYEGLLNLVHIEIVDAPNQNQRPSKGGSLKKRGFVLGIVW
ncbi:hypothetical protein DSO57_1022708 [Entomophthora muscae]|uniref:Uncharacterized protein n=1 Tax=Entomophthora muscae TaxID=34485 RepID=A0ACC2UNU4_9FUNG|nr:hypothetical protein DSO57_1022708 [Entomophthora muscae]